MKVFQHRVEVHSREGRFLGAAEFKTFKKQRAERALQKDLMSRVSTVVRSAKEHVCTFTLNNKIEYRK